MSSQFPFHFVTGWLGAKSFLREFTKSLPVKPKSFYTRKNKKERSGSVCCVGRFGGALNLNVHFHLLQIEGVYELKKTATAKFKKRKAPSGHDIKNLVMVIREKIIKHLRRSGYLYRFCLDFPEGVKERAAQQRKQHTGNFKQDWYST